jgi:hypothetical protein
MRLMHNEHDVHASREITSSRLESPDYVCCDCRGEKHHRGSIPSGPQPARSEPGPAARALFQDDLLIRSPNGFELTLRGRKILEELEGLLPRMENLVVLSRFGGRLPSAL